MLRTSRKASRCSANMQAVFEWCSSQIQHWRWKRGEWRVKGSEDRGNNDYIMQSTCRLTTRQNLGVSIHVPNVWRKQQRWLNTRFRYLGIKISGDLWGQTYRYRNFQQTLFTYPFGFPSALTCIIMCHHSFIHSRIYKAPLQEIYAEAPPAQPHDTD